MISSQTQYLLQQNGPIPQFGWGRMVTKFMQNNITIKLVNDSSFFGKSRSKGQGECFTFNSTNTSPELLQQISREFFIISLQPGVQDSTNYRPALIQVLGRNGLYVNNVLLKKNQRTILHHGDIIYFTADTPLFQFLDDRDFVIPRRILEKYRVGESIADGAQGSVRLVRSLINGNTFAMKSISKGRYERESDYDFVKRLQHMTAEVKIMKELFHPNVIRLIEAAENCHQLAIIMELAVGGNLLDHITNSPNGCLQEAEAKFCCFQLCKGLNYVHSKGIAHRDIKVDNVFITKINHWQRGEIIYKIGDFGFAKKIDQVLLTQLGTRCFLPPEIQDCRDPYTLSADIWTLGCLFFVCLSGRFPFHEAYGSSVSQQIATADVSFDGQELWNDISQDVKLLIKAMIQVSSNQRPSIGYILENAVWFKDNALINRAKFLYRYLTNIN